MKIHAEEPIPNADVLVFLTGQNEVMFVVVKEQTVFVAVLQTFD